MPVRARTSKERKRDDAQAAIDGLKTIAPAAITSETLLEYAEHLKVRHALQVRHALHQIDAEAIRAASVIHAGHKFSLEPGSLNVILQKRMPMWFWE